MGDHDRARRPADLERRERGRGHGLRWVGSGKRREILSGRNRRDGEVTPPPRVKKLQLSTAIARIRDRGALLVFPINNRPQPPSLWMEFFPKSPMIWDWNEDADSRVA